MSIGQSGQVYPVDPSSGVVYDSSYPYTPDGAWITVRVPADELTGMVRELSALGEVTASSVNRQDVTEQTVDLRARIEASQASVDRLTELMSQATSVADLIAAESALAERQATLESYQAQLEVARELRRDVEPHGDAGPRRRSGRGRPRRLHRRIGRRLERARRDAQRNRGGPRLPDPLAPRHRGRRRSSCGASCGSSAVAGRNGQRPRGRPPPLARRRRRRRRAPTSRRVPSASGAPATRAATSAR